MRLSKAQVNLLRILRDKNTTVIILRAVRGGPNTFIKNGQGKNLRYDTVLKLAKLGLIENITEEEWRWREWEYRITEVGMDAIKEAA